MGVSFLNKKSNNWDITHSSRKSGKIRPQSWILEEFCARYTALRWDRTFFVRSVFYQVLVLYDVWLWYVIHPFSPWSRLRIRMPRCVAVYRIITAKSVVQLISSHLWIELTFKCLTKFDVVFLVAEYTVSHVTHWALVVLASREINEKYFPDNKSELVEAFTFSFSEISSTIYTSAASMHAESIAALPLPPMPTACMMVLLWLACSDKTFEGVLFSMVADAVPAIIFCAGGSANGMSHRSNPNLYGRIYDARIVEVMFRDQNRKNIIEIPLN